MSNWLSQLEIRAGLSARALLAIAGTVLALLVAAIWLATLFLDPIPPRRVVLAAGPEDGTLHRFGLRYRAILARNGITVDVRVTRGTPENLEMLRRQDEPADIAFLNAGLARGEQATGLVKVANIAYAPLWTLYRSERELSEIRQLKGLRLAVGEVSSGLDALLAPVLAANGISPENSRLVRLPTREALQALSTGNIDAVFTGEGPPGTDLAPVLRAPGIRLMSFDRADAYARRYPHLHSLTLPAGTIDLERNLPERDLNLVAAQIMIVGRDTLHPTVIDLLVDAAREIHGAPGLFQRRGEFPDTTPVDEVRVSEQAIRYARSGPSFLRRYLPLWIADFVQRLITLALPVALVLVPAIRRIPGAIDALARGRIENEYAALRLVEQRLAADGSASPDALRRELDRIETAAATMRVPVAHARDLYALRSHVQIVQRALAERASRT